MADLLSLIKPRITAMVLVTMLGGIWLASRVSHGQRSLLTLAIAVIGTGLVVSGANTLNMYLERYTDKLMARTKNRPLPSGRLAPEIALWFGIALSAVSVPLLTFG